MLSNELQVVRMCIGYECFRLGRLCVVAGLTVVNLACFGAVLLAEAGAVSTVAQMSNAAEPGLTVSQVTRP